MCLNSSEEIVGSNVLVQYIRILALLSMHVVVTYVILVPSVAVFEKFF